MQPGRVNLGNVDSKAAAQPPAVAPQLYLARGSSHQPLINEARSKTTGHKPGLSGQRS